MEAAPAMFPTTVTGLLCMARVILRDMGMSKEERDEEMEVYKTLDYEELKNCMHALNEVHKHKYCPSATPATGSPGIGATQSLMPTIAPVDAPTTLPPLPVTPGSVGSR